MQIQQRLNNKSNNIYLNLLRGFVFFYKAENNSILAIIALSEFVLNSLNLCQDMSTLGKTLSTLEFFSKKAVHI